MAGFKTSISSSLKREASSSDLQLDAQRHQRIPAVHVVESTRVAMTVLALVAGIVALGLSAHTLSVYNATLLPSDFFLPLWPNNFDLRPTNAFVAASSIVVAVNALSVFASRTKPILGRPLAHAPLNMLVAAVAFVASLVAVILFYAINASASVDTLQSWVCRWQDVPMSTRPYFGGLCNESRTALGLIILSIPLEFVIFGLACVQIVMEKKGAGGTVKRGGSPSFP